MRSSQALAVVSDFVGTGRLASYVGSPRDLDYWLRMGEPWGGFADWDVVGRDLRERVAYAPLVYSQYRGWETRLSIQNLDASRAARIKLSFLDDSGAARATLSDWICPRGSQTYALSQVADLPADWAGSARIESLTWQTHEEDFLRASSISGVALIINESDPVAAPKSAPGALLAYALLHGHANYRWTLEGEALVRQGVPLVALPGLQKGSGPASMTSAFTVMNLAQPAGFTDFGVYLYDQNALVDMFCQRLGDRQSRVFDLADWGFVDAGFRGSALISASHWEHETRDAQGLSVNNVVGLGALSFDRRADGSKPDFGGEMGGVAAGMQLAPSAAGLSCRPSRMPACGQP